MGFTASFTQPQTHWPTHVLTHTQSFTHSLVHLLAQAQPKYQTSKELVIGLFTNYPTAVVHPNFCHYEPDRSHLSAKKYKRDTIDLREVEAPIPYQFSFEPIGTTGIWVPSSYGESFVLLTKICFLHFRKVFFMMHGHMLHNVLCIGVESGLSFK